MSEGDALRGWLRPVEAPPGGIDGLRRRLAHRARRRTVARRVTAGLAAAALVASGALALRGLTSPRRLPGWATADLMAVELGLVEAPAEPVTVAPPARGRIAVQRLPTADARVALYLVGRRD